VTKSVNLRNLLDSQAQHSGAGRSTSA